MSTSVIWHELVDTVTSSTRAQLLTAKDEEAIHDHRADREEFIRELVATAGIDKPDRYLDNVLTYRVDPGDRDAPPLDELDTRAVARRVAWRNERREARITAGSSGGQRISATRQEGATMTMAMNEVLTAAEASRLTGIPISTLHDWAAKRERGINSPGPHHCKLSSRHRRWMRADVVEWLAASRC